MADLPIIGEIRMFAGSFAPDGWARCNGQMLPINDETFALWQEIGTTYGGDGESVFAVPDLRGRVPIHQGNGFTLADFGGDEALILTVQQIPAHTHPLRGSLNTATSNNPQGRVPASLSPAGTASAYADASPPLQDLDPTSISPAGGTQPHPNMQPYLCVEFIISLIGSDPGP